MMYGKERIATSTFQVSSIASSSYADGDGVNVVRGPEERRLEAEGVYKWPIWTCESSEFPWKYDQNETCYLLEGEVTVIPDDGEPVSFQAGDLVSFPAGMSCTWKVTKAVKKHYRFH